MSSAGSVIVTLAVAVHPLASVTVTSYVPAHNPERSSVTARFDQAKAKGAVPPATARSAAPSQTPLQFRLVPVIAAVSSAGPVIVTLAVAVHPLASVTVTSNVPAHNPERSSVTARFDHAKAKGAVPPITFRSAAPSQTPLQLGLVPAMVAGGRIQPVENSSAPIVGVTGSLRSPSKSSGTIVIRLVPPRSPIGEASVRCKSGGAANIGSSETEFASMPFIACSVGISFIRAPNQLTIPKRLLFGT